MVIKDLMILGEENYPKLGLDLARSELDASTTKMCKWRVTTALNSWVASIAITEEGLRDLANKGQLADQLTLWQWNYFVGSESAEPLL